LAVTARGKKATEQHSKEIRKPDEKYFSSELLPKEHWLLPKEQFTRATGMPERYLLYLPTKHQG